MKKKEPLIFIVEDDAFVNLMISSHLSDLGYSKVEVFGSGEDALANRYKMPGIVICDYHLSGDLDGSEVLKEIKAFNPDIHVIMLSGQEKMDVAVNSLKYGAYDYVVKGDGAIEKVGKLVQKADAFNSALKSNRWKRVFSAFMFNF